jgi:hypothetical protein
MTDIVVVATEDQRFVVVEEANNNITVSSPPIVAVEVTSPGPQGIQGPQGPAGTAGQGVAAGGAAGDLLVKNSATNYDTTWTDAPTVDILGFDTTAAETLSIPGTIAWNDGDGTLDLLMKGGNVTQQIGEQEYARVFNDSGGALTKGQVVYISGAHGNRVAVKLARADTEVTSRATIGFVAENMASGAQGFIIVSGALYKLNTFGLTEGQPLYLSTTTAGAYTTTPSVAPNHLVVLGWVERVHATVGSIYIKIDNGYELDELHNVYINNIQPNDYLRYNGANSRWENVGADSTGFVPYTGATTGLNLGSQSLQTIGNVGFGTAPGTSEVEVRANDNAFIAPTGATVFSDTFTEASTTLLNLHTPNVGTNWSLALSTGGATYSVFNNGTVRPTTSLLNVGCLYLANNVAPAAAVDVSITASTVVTGANVVGLVFRYVDSNNYYLLTLSNTQANCILYKKVAGVWTNLGTTSIGMAAGAVWRVRAVGTNIVVYAGSTIVKITSDSGITAAGLCGLSAGTIGQNATDDVANGWQLDNFSVTNYASSGGLITNGINVTGDIQASGQIVGHGNNSAIYPAITFANNTNTGLYVSAAGNLSIATGGSIRATFNSSGLAISSACYVGAGSAGGPTISFGADANTGFYNPAGDQLGVAVGGVLRWTFDGNGRFFTSDALAPPGAYDIATSDQVSNSGGSAGGFTVLNVIDGIVTRFRAVEYSSGGGFYGDGKLLFVAGNEPSVSVNPGIDFYINPTGYNSQIGDFNIGIGAVDGTSGGNVTIEAGTSSYGGSGGNVSLIAGSGNDDNGGNVYLAGGLSATQTGGSVILAAGSSNDTNGGPVTIYAGTGVLDGGNVNIGGGYGTSNGGDVFISGGDTETVSAGGSVNINGGQDDSSGYGDVNIGTTGGNVYIGTNVSIYLSGMIVDNSSYAAIDVQSRQLYNAIGTPVFNWDTQTIADTNFVIAMAAAL